jgi:hypothetical protein
MMERIRVRSTVPTVLLLAVALSVGCTSPTATTATPSVAATATSALTATAAAVSATEPSPDATMTFAVIGDYGWRGPHELAVSKLVKSWGPAFVITTGDDYYTPAGGTGTARYDRSTGAYYSRWLKDINTSGTIRPSGEATINAFFPALGNHDYSDARPALRTYLTYFKLPGTGFINTSGNERYYDYVEGPVHFFVLNSNKQEPGGTGSTSAQARWLKRQLASSTSTWNVVYDHHPPYSSDKLHGSSAYMRWPFAAWGADVVFSGHSHTYERITRGGITYFVNGLGGAPRYAFAATHVAGSARRFKADWGAQKVTVAGTTMTFEFYTVTGALKDRFSLVAGAR